LGEVRGGGGKGFGGADDGKGVRNARVLGQPVVGLG